MHCFTLRSVQHEKGGETLLPNELTLLFSSERVQKCCSRMATGRPRMFLNYEPLGWGSEPQSSITLHSFSVITVHHHLNRAWQPLGVLGGEGLNWELCWGQRGEGGSPPCLHHIHTISPAPNCAPPWDERDRWCFGIDGALGSGLS